MNMGLHSQRSKLGVVAIVGRFNVEKVKVKRLEAIASHREGEE